MKIPLNFCHNFFPNVCLFMTQFYLIILNDMQWIQQLNIISSSSHSWHIFLASFQFQNISFFPSCLLLGLHFTCYHISKSALKHSKRYSLFMFDIWLVCILFEKIAQKIPCSAERKTERKSLLKRKHRLRDKKKPLKEEEHREWNKDSEKSTTQLKNNYKECLSFSLIRHEIVVNQKCEWCTYCGIPFILCSYPNFNEPIYINLCMWERSCVHCANKVYVKYLFIFIKHFAFWRILFNEWYWIFE